MEISSLPPTPPAGSPAPFGARGGEPFSYRPIPGVWDEMFEANGAVRAHWQKFHAMLSELGVQGMQNHSGTVARLLHDHGATYNAFQDTGAAGRPWSLDAMPVLLATEDFAGIEKGLQQRMRLFQAMIQDIHGPQRMLHLGWVPPRLLHANPGYLRQIQDLPSSDPMLYIMATDLIRGPNGSWQVLADRCQMPNGLGYSLENRIVLSQIFPREFKECRVQRLASFFERERDMMRELSPANRSQPNVVMVTPGPQDRGYFEHAFKARCLGFSLVEGADLTVRDTRLYLKTLEGLRQVDVLIRRMEDRFCDSLELDADAWTGVPGLLEAWRNGKVSIANGIGTGVLEAPAWLPFLSGLCRNLLGEELLIPAVPTWWCGQQREREMVLANPRRWVFKRAYCGADRPSQAAANLDNADLTKLIAAIRAQPESWVAQEMQTLSSAPMWTGSGLQPRSFVLRTFSCSSRQECHVMPGALGRVSPQKEGFLVSIEAGAISKDVWVIAEGEVDQKTLLGGQPEVLRVARLPGAVPSRMADHLFWLGRYAERMEQTSRMLRMLCQRLGGEGIKDQSRELALGLRLAREVELTDFPHDETRKATAIQQEIHDLLENPARKGSVAFLSDRLRFNAAAARDRLSDDTWRLFNYLFNESSAPSQCHSATDMIAKLNRIILDMATFSGMQSENMVQGHGWRFLEIGRRIERGMASAVYNRAAIVISAGDDSVLGPMLEIFDSSMTYRRHHFARPKLLFVLDLLMLNAANPRSLSFQLEAMYRQVLLLPKGSSVHGAEKAVEEVEKMRGMLGEIDLMAMEPDSPTREILSTLCETLSNELEKFSNQLTEHYFSHTKRRSRQS